MELIPEQLLRSHEDGRVIFFCGAGVSVPAGLPSFRELIELTLVDLLPTRDQCESNSMESMAWRTFDDGKYDETLGILESPQQGGYDAKDLRGKVNNLLSNPRAKTLDKHLVLAQLAGLDTVRGRLVTTNFDNLFERAQKKLKKQENSIHKVNVHIAPALPPAKPESFQGLAYLHGKLGSSIDDQHLVLTSADFGTAYMLEGWALRFVIDLFRHYHVVFVGYSLEDPTMRYLVQALAAARNDHLEQFKEPYAFAPYCSGTGKDKNSVEQQWNIKGITPILYDNVQNHQQLWQSLKKWADMYHQGITGRRQIVARLGQFPPVSDQNDSTIQDMVWALNDADVARYSANQISGRRIHPGWIAPLQEQGLLSLPIGQSNDARPISVPLVSFRQLPDYFDLNEVTNHLGRWVAQCLDSQNALDWALMNGAVLHSQFRREIRQQLQKDTTHIPTALQTIWRILSDESYAIMLSEKYGFCYIYGASYLRLAPDEILDLRVFLNQLCPIPIIKCKSDYLRYEQIRDPDKPQDWCEIDIELIGISYEDDINEFRNNARDWDGTLVAIVDEVTILLHEAMDWLNVFGLANSIADLTHIEYRSISPHEQNQFAHTWTQLIALARESCDILVARGDLATAIGLLQKWKSIPYPVFRRLVLHAVTEYSELDIELGLMILLDEIQPALWGSPTLRETLRFIRKRGKDFQLTQLNRLIEMILRGPPRETYQNDLTEENWNTRRDNEILLRLHKLKESGVSLPELAEKTYDRIQQDRQWQPRGDHSEEFSIFVSDFTEYDPFDSGQRKNFFEMSSEQFDMWLNSQKGSSMHPWESNDGWSKFVANNIKIAVELLKGSENTNNWIPHVWYPVLKACRTNEDVPSKLNQEIAKLIIDMPIPPLDVLALEAARWLEVVWRNLNKTLRRNLWQKIWEASCVDECPTHELDSNMTVNHAGGILGNVLYKELTEYYPKIAPAQNLGFPRWLIHRFRCIADSETPSAKLARVRLSPMLYVFFRIDPGWTERTYFDRMNPTIEDRFDQFLWEGFFWHSRCPTDLLHAIKHLLFEVLRCLDRIPNHIHSRAVELFTYLAVPPIYGITIDEAKDVLWKFSPDKLVYVARALNVMLRDADERSLTFWSETLQPWFTNVWPKRAAAKSPTLSESLARMAIESGDAFPFVVEVITDILTNENGRFALNLLDKYEKDTKLVSEYPEASLTLIDKLYHEGSCIYGLGELLNAVGKASPSLKETASFERLSLKL